MKLSALTPDTRNANKGTDRGRKLVKESLRKYGAGRSILIDKSGNVIAGNKTLEGAKAVGLEDVQIVKSDGTRLVAVQRTDLDINDKAARELAIADNRASELGLEWDPDILKSLETEVDVDLSGFWDERELVQFWAKTDGEAPEPKLDQAAELQREWKTERGQVWQIGRHRLVCGDATSAEDVAQLMNGAKGQMLFTDPPYGVAYSGQRVHSGKFVKDFQPTIEGDAVDAGEIYKGSLIALLPHMDDTAAFYIWFAASHSLTTYTALTEAGLRAKALIIWHKINTGFGNLNHHYKHKHEPCIYGSKLGCAEKWYGPNNEVTVWDIPKLGDNDLHPTMKPVELPARAISNSSEPDDIVVDLFVGSAGTMVAAEQSKRTCYALEIEPKYVAVALQRLADMGLKPELQHA